MFRQRPIINLQILLILGLRNFIALRRLLEAILGPEHGYNSTQTPRALPMFDNIQWDFGGDISAEKKALD